MTGSSESSIYDAVIVGGGAAGLGVTIALQHADITNVLVLERETVGASFAAWPAETRFITPSFPSNSIGMLDLNSIAIGVSPAFSLQVEHPNGQEYAAHLRELAKHANLPIREHTDVKQIQKIDGVFHIETSEATFRAKHVVWAAGEFQYPRLSGFPGSELCRHTATIESYTDLANGPDTTHPEFAIIGGSESGVDAAYHLAAQGKKVQLFDAGCPWHEPSSDPSLGLSTYSLERMKADWFEQHVEQIPRTPIASVARLDDGYEIVAQDGRRFQTGTRPLLAHGFVGSHTLVASLFEPRDDGYPKLNAQDESTLVPSLFLCGPAVRHDHHIFCFIYKYRQRFAVVAKAIANALGQPAVGLEKYRQWGMFLDDLSIVGEECLTC